MSDQQEEMTYYQRNRERLLAQATAYRLKHREKYREYWKTYYQENKKELIEKHRLYCIKNRDQIKARKRTVFYPKAKKEKVKPKEPISETPTIDQLVLNPTVEVPAFSMIISPGEHIVTFD